MVMVSVGDTETQGRGVMDDYEGDKGSCRF